VKIRFLQAELTGSILNVNIRSQLSLHGRDGLPAAGEKMEESTSRGVTQIRS
jgi:hypothetical protein